MAKWLQKREHALNSVRAHCPAPFLGHREIYRGEASLNNKHRQKWPLVNPLSAVLFVRDFVLAPRFLRFFSTSLAWFHLLLCVVEMLRLVCGKKYGGVVVVRLHHSLNANFNKRGKLRENCDGAKHFLQGSCFFFFFFFLLRHRSGVINEISNASRDSNVFQFASNFRDRDWRALILILRSFFNGKGKELFCIRFYKFQKLQHLLY